MQRAALLCKDSLGKASSRAKVLGLLCTNRHTEADVPVCEHMRTPHPPMPLCNTHRPSTQMWSQGFRYTHQDEHFQTQVKGERIAQ